MTATALTLRVPKAAELVADQLRRRIVRGELQDGDALPPEAVLMDDFGVSRPTLREAFRVLESERLIEVHRGSRGGARVRVPTNEIVARYAGLVLEHGEATVADVGTARGILEPECAAVIARRRSPADVARLRAALVEAEALTDPAAQLDAQHGFHTLLVSLAGNQTIQMVHGVVQQILDRADRARQSAQTPEAEHARHLGARAHRKLVELIDAGDAAGAAALWQRHVDEAAGYLLRGNEATTVLDLL
ncbi:MAG: FadR/GntR family transcriptional regulator [Acidimicrobiales bacterium]